MPKLVINPGAPTAREFQLKPGSNHIGRSDANDVHLPDPSVSSSHCQILVDEQGVLIRDLGSTNGTFINRAPVQEARLQNGQTLRLGGVEMVFYSDSNAPVTAPRMPPPPPPAPMPAAAPRLSIGATSRGATAVASPPPLRTAAAEGNTEVVEPPAAPPVAPMPMGPAFCKFHPKSPARWQCPKCNRGFCDLCVTARSVGGASIKTCRSCAVEVRPLQVRHVRPAAKRGFFGSLPGAFAYPFKGMGVVILICATLTLAALEYFGGGIGIFSLLIALVFYGFLFLFMQNIIHSTANDETEALTMPSPDGIFGAAFRFIGLMLICFGVPVVASILVAFEVDLPIAAPLIMGLSLLGCVYFPMALLAVAMKDDIMAMNPLLVIPAILKSPLQYAIAVLLLLGVYGVRQLGDMFSGVANEETFTSREVSTVLIALGVQVIWKFVSVYLLTVSVRIMGLFYNANKEELGWY